MLRRGGRNWLAFKCRYKVGTAGYSSLGRCEALVVLTCMGTKQRE